LKKGKKGSEMMRRGRGSVGGKEGEKKQEEERGREQGGRGKEGERRVKW